MKIISVDVNDITMTVLSNLNVYFTSLTRNWVVVTAVLYFFLLLLFNDEFKIIRVLKSHWKGKL